MAIVVGLQIAALYLAQISSEAGELANPTPIRLELSQHDYGRTFVPLQYADDGRGNESMQRLVRLLNSRQTQFGIDEVQIFAQNATVRNPFEDFVVRKMKELRATRSRAEAVNAYQVVCTNLTVRIPS